MIMIIMMAMVMYVMINDYHYHAYVALSPLSQNWKFNHLTNSDFLSQAFDIGQKKLGINCSFSTP